MSIPVLCEVVLQPSLPDRLKQFWVFRYCGEWPLRKNMILLCRGLNFMGIAFYAQDHPLPYRILWILNAKNSYMAAEKNLSMVLLEMAWLSEFSVKAVDYLHYILSGGRLVAARVKKRRTRPFIFWKCIHAGHHGDIWK